MAVADQIFDGTKVILPFLENEIVARTSQEILLSQGVGETFIMMSFARFLRDDFMPLCRNQPCIGFILGRMQRGLCTMAIADMTRNPLAPSIHRGPAPLLVGFLGCVAVSSE
jgi:hypothetical protein